MQITVVSPHELGPDEIAAWRSMQHQTDYLGSLFLSPECTLAAGAFRPNARVAVLSDGPELAGFFPFGHAPGAAWDPPSPVIGLAGGFDAYQDKLRVKSPRFRRPA